MNYMSRQSGVQTWVKQTADTAQGEQHQPTPDIHFQQIQKLITPLGNHWYPG
jgi:hypothetical protein